MWIRKSSFIKMQKTASKYVKHGDIIPGVKVTKLPSYLIGVFMIIRKYTDDAFIVGGAVRDLILGKEPKDYDIVANVEPDALEEDFIKSGWAVKEAGKDFAVLHVHKGDMELEIARFRKDLHPDSNTTEVALGDIYDDAVRRDLTINALYLDPFTGEVHDPSGEALKTIEKDRELKFMGDPEQRIDEDHTRMLRFYRFIDKLRDAGFKVNEESLNAVRKNFHKLRTIDHNRIREELEKMTGLKHLEDTLNALSKPREYPKGVDVPRGYFKNNPEKVLDYIKLLNRLKSHGYLPATGTVPAWRKGIEKMKNTLPPEQFYTKMEELAGHIPDVRLDSLEKTIKVLEEDLETLLSNPRTPEREQRMWDIYKRKQDAISDYLETPKKWGHLF